MISLSESCDCRMDYWQSSPTCSVGNTSKIGWNTPLVHYCIDGWDLILFHLNQTIHAMYKDYLGNSADGSVFFAAGSQGGQSISYPFPARGGPGSFFMLVPLAQRQTDRTCPSASVLATFLNRFFDVAFT